MLSTFTGSFKFGHRPAVVVSGGGGGGALGVVLMYDRAITTDEIAQNYNTLRSRFGISQFLS